MHRFQTKGSTVKRQVITVSVFLTMGMIIIIIASYQQTIVPSPISSFLNIIALTIAITIFGISFPIIEYIYWPITSILLYEDHMVVRKMRWRSDEVSRIEFNSGTLIDIDLDENGQGKDNESISRINISNGETVVIGPQSNWSVEDTGRIFESLIPRVQGTDTRFGETLNRYLLARP